MDEGMDGHPDDARLLALLDGELDGAARARLEKHLEGCGACRRRRDELARASQVLTRELRAQDVEPPPGDPLAVRRKARVRRGGGRRRGLAPSTFWKAAVLVLGLGAAASATVPGSPVKGWLSDAVRALVAGFSAPPGQDAAPADTAPTDAEPAAAEGPQGVSIPVAGRAEVRIVEPAPGLTIVVRTLEGAVLSIVARGARYRAGEGEVEVVGPDGPELRVDLPASADTVRILADGRVVVERVGGRLRVRGAAVDTVDGTLSVSLDGPGG